MKKPHKGSVGMNHHHPSKEEHKEMHCSDGQRHAEGRFKIAQEERMHENKNTGK